MHRAHPVGHPRRPHRRQRPPAPRRDHGRLALIHNGIIENFHALKKSCSPRASSSLRDRHRGRRPARRPRAYDRTGDLTEAMRAVGRRSRAPSRCWRARRPAPVSSSGARRNSPLVVGLGRARTSSAPTSRPSSATPASASSSARTRSSRSPRTATRSSASTAHPAEGKPYQVTGTPPPPRRAATTPSWPRRSTSSRTPSPTPCWAAPTRTASWSSTRLRISEEQLRAVDKIVIVACGTAAYSPGWSRSTPSSTGPGSRARSSWPTSSATRPGRRRATRSSSRSASPARRWTP
jgi:glucosamine--fructose-6-phosphate aminotransferase (isomerizing)